MSVKTWRREMDELEQLQRRAAGLEADAKALTQAYKRATWIRFVLFFFPAPLIVVLFRLSLEAWGYYAVGALFILSGAVLFAVDSAASVKCDTATRAAESARQAVEAARRQAQAIA